MKSIFKYLSRASGIKPQHPPERLIFFFLLLLIYTPALLSSSLVARVEGEVKVRLGILGQQALLLTPGTLLPQQAELEFAKGAKIWILCAGLSQPKRIDADNQSEPYCPQGHSYAMRASEDSATPFLLIPNQPQLKEIDRLVWSGPGNADYRLILIRIDANGEEKPHHKPWTHEGKAGEAVAIHRIQLAQPLRLPFTDPPDGTEFRLLVENLDNSRSSEENYDLIHSIQEIPPPRLTGQTDKLLVDLGIAENTRLGRIVQADYLIDRGHRSEAYGLLDSPGDATFRAQARVLQAKCFDIPGTPADLVIEGYAEALQFALEDSAPLSAVIACQGLFSKSPELLTAKGKALQSKVIQNPKLSRYCYAFKHHAPN